MLPHEGHRLPAPVWGHGHWKGEFAIAGESWKTADLDEMRSRTSTSSRSCARAAANDEGVGVLEQIAIGPHPKYGFKSFLDPAR